MGIVKLVAAGLIGMLLSFPAYSAEELPVRGRDMAPKAPAPKAPVPGAAPPKAAAPNAAAAALNTAWTTGDLSMLLNQPEFGTCAQDLEDAVSAVKTVEQRFNHAREAEECVLRLRAYMAASRSSATDRAVVEAIIAPYALRVAEAKKNAEAENEFLGLRWGVGIGWSVGFDDNVSEAVVDASGIVRVRKSEKEQPRVLLEFHKFFWHKNTDGTRGVGPFVAVSATPEKLLQGVGLGVMYGRKAKPGDSDGFSVGIGLILDAKVKDLADGFVDGQPAPGGATTVPLEEESRWAGLLMVTRTWDVFQ